ncbi:MAG: hypothetical protein ABS63_01875 [Microbacterium sp. SCN 70-27]|nr:MAG: hypothetical protein ABS63_01875 [Microbacterium sp. SCN 70-27]
MEAGDRLWWARTIRASSLVDLELVRAQGHRGGVRSAVRRYVRGGFHEGFALHPMLLERMVAGQLSDVGRVPALYAYLVNDSARVSTTVAWDAPAFAAEHPDSAAGAGGVLGAASRRARAGQSLDVLGVPATWTDLSGAALPAARASVEGSSTSLRAFSEPRGFVCRIAADEDASAALRVVHELAERSDTAVVIAIAPRATDIWVAASLLRLRHPRIQIVADDGRVMAALFSLRPDAVLVVRGPHAEITATDLNTLAHNATDRAVAPLWLDAADGTVASAGVVAHDGIAVPLLRDHPEEDARALPAALPVVGIEGESFAAPAPSRRVRQPLLLPGATVRAPRPTRQPALAAPPGTPAVDLADVLAPLRLQVDRSSTASVRLTRSPELVSLPDGRTVPRLRWAIRIAAPPGRRGEWWGDTHFARGIADALRRLGQEVVIDSYAARSRATSYLDDVVLALRGPEPIAAQRGARSLLWIISHPDEIREQDVAGFDAVFAASEPWARAATQRLGRSILPLLQCTDTSRFRPAGLPRGADLVFVGTARGIPRPSIIEPLRAGIPVSVYGPDWSGWIPGSAIKGSGVPNDRLPAVYERAGAVLNDHWPAMRREGFVSNRLFDVVAAGGRAISDDVEGIDDLFGAAVRTYGTIAELIGIAADDLDSEFPAESDLAAIAESVRIHHSFDARAATLLDAALAR